VVVVVVVGELPAQVRRLPAPSRVVNLSRRLRIHGPGGIAGMEVTQ
jgi:hypothetical protein